jgi:hypothetical protein
VAQETLEQNPQPVLIVQLKPSELFRQFTEMLEDPAKLTSAMRNDPEGKIIGEIARQVRLYVHGPMEQGPDVWKQGTIPSSSVPLDRKGFFTNAGVNLIDRLDFFHKKVAVTQIVCEMGNKPGIRKLLWARAPFEEMFVDGTPNPCIHSDFAVDSKNHPENLAFDYAKKMVQQTFDKLYGLS